MKSHNSANHLRTALYENNIATFVAAIIFQILGASCNLIISWQLGAALDAISSSDRLCLYRLGIFVLISVPTIFLINTAATIIKARFVHRGISQYKTKAFEILTKKSISTISGENTGKYLSAFTNDSISVETNYLNNIVLFVYYVSMLIMTLAMMIWYNPLLTLIVIILSFLPVTISVLMGKELAGREKKVSDKNEHYTSKLKDILSGFAVIKCFKAEKRLESVFCAQNHALEVSKEKRRRYLGIITSASESSGMAVQFCIIFIGALFVFSGKLTVGSILVFVNLCNFVNQPVQNIPTCYANLKAAKVLIDKFGSILDETGNTLGAPAPQAIKSNIAVQNLSFGYEASSTILKGLSCNFESGKSYAIVGGSGSGKTTLLKLLMGSYRTYDGLLSIDGTDVKSFSSDSMYDLMSLIDQNIFLFDDTIRNNITMFASFPDEEVNRAIKLAGLEDVIKERGEDYSCGENGNKLSGGERQRIAIARSLLKGSNVLLVDEATASLDNETAKHVSTAILALKNMTRIVVTHRLDEQILKQYDEIIMLKNGIACEIGNFKDLMEEKGQFYSLYMVAGN
ncbi:ABC transporter ATP-binding protein [Butyrivibrio sp. INlla16]|uniref:ABC transporter ATP-binding protein n=1 Tax=Butyrivibrio sp. INlla16 TaxID=1520807 RepID=UPI00089017AA|nr:ABC transporter ATP-binding protein [Butyrivibrio sp. INlla16]SDB61362.1 ABC-type multidrug transport system, ATPase and permease component [Butyrivibrio sp. INlla16]